MKEEKCQRCKSDKPTIPFERKILCANCINDILSKRCTRMRIAELDHIICPKRYTYEGRK